MFTVEQRDAVRKRVMRLADEDPRVITGAVVGSLAHGGGDRYSDLDLTFSVTARAGVAGVLADWTRVLVDELDAVHLVDVDGRGKTYRVFVLPGGLQLDLSMGSAEDAGSDVASGPPVSAGDLFGWGVIYALHANASLARGRLWQAEHYAGAVRDHALTLACLRFGLRTAEARGFDDLPPEVLAEFGGVRTATFTEEGLREALAASVEALLREGAEAHLPHADLVGQRVRRAVRRL